jgi:hypothetical protein
MRITTEQAFFIVTNHSGELAVYLPDSTLQGLLRAFHGRLRSAGPFGQKLLSSSYVPGSDRRLVYHNERAALSELLHPKFRDLHLGLHPAHDWLQLAQRHRNVIKDDFMLIQLRDLSCSTRLIIDELADDHQRLIFRVLRALAPALLAVSASSPLWRHVDTGFASYRAILLRQRPFSGTCPIEALDDINQYESAPEIQSGYWDVHLKPLTGRIEAIICDAFVYEEALIMIVNLLARIFERCFDDPNWVFRTFPEATPLIEYNRWEAAKSGLRGQFWTPHGTYSAFELLKQMGDDMFRDEGDLGRTFNSVLNQQYKWSSKTLADEGFPLLKFQAELSSEPA